MKSVALVKTILFAAVAALLLIFHDSYTSFTASLSLPEKLAPTLYRVLIASCFIECARLLIIIFYTPQNLKTRKDNFTIGVSHLSKICYGLLIGVLILSLFNITLKEALTTLSLIAAAVVLMTKDYIANLINGMYLTFTKVINIDDQVQIEEHKGKILDITLTNVHLLNDDDDIIYIPNNKVFTSEIINYTRRELKKSNVEFSIDSAYAPTAAELEKRIIDSLAEYSEHIQPESYTLKIQAIKFEYVQFKFQFILVNPMNKEIDKKIRRHIARFVLEYITELRKR